MFFIQDTHIDSNGPFFLPDHWSVFPTGSMSTWMDCNFNDGACVAWGPECNEADIGQFVLLAVLSLRFRWFAIAVRSGSSADSTTSDN